MLQVALENSQGRFQPLSDVDTVRIAIDGVKMEISKAPDGKSIMVAADVSIAVCPSAANVVYITPIHHSQHPSQAPSN